MATSYNSNIVTDGLVLCLDAANPRSYPLSGNTWLDLSGQGNNGALTNGPTFSSDNAGSIAFDGSNDYVSIPNLPSIGTKSFSCEIISKITDTTGSKYFFGNWGYNGGNQLGFQMFRPGWALDRFYFSIYDTDNSTQANGGNFGSFTIDEYFHIVVTRNGTDIKIYINANTPRTVTTGFTFNIDRTYMNLHHAGDGASYTSGSCSLFRFYLDKALTADEVRRNYNATRGRYGN